jgi:cytochrome c6
VRRLSVIAAAVLGAFLLAGCNSEGVATPTPNTVVGPQPTTPTVTFPIVPAYQLKGNPTKGSAAFTTTCGSCHTLAAAHTTGTVGPNLDQLKPDYRAVTAQVTNGGASMPSFKGTLSTQQIADVSAYVVKSTGGTAP